MPKFTCDYCNSALTHDSISVRRSHVTGKNHVRYYVDYYETVAKESGLLPKDFILTSDGGGYGVSSVNSNEKLDQHKQIQAYLEEGVPGLTSTKNNILNGIVNRPILPVPPRIKNLPPPPSQFYHKSAELGSLMQ